MNPVYRFGPFRMDPVTRRLSRDGVPIDTTAKMFDTLLVLVRHSGQVVTRERMLQEVWPDAVIEDNNVSVHISKLRRALGESAKEWRYIETVARRGYRFSSVVDYESRSRSTRAHVHEHVHESGQGSGGDELQWPRLGGPFDHRVISAEPTAERACRETGSRAFIDARERPRIAVLPFQNIAGDEYFAHGMTESLIANLAQIGSLRVISRTSVMRFRKRSADLPQIAEELGADYIVEGSILQASERVRITAQLIRAADDEHVWAQQYEREMRDVLALQNEVAMEVSRGIGVRLTSEEARTLDDRPVLSDPTVYRLYLRGRFLRHRNTPEDFLRAIENLEEAVARDANFAPAYSLLAQSHFMLGLFGVVPWDAAAKRFRDYVEEGLRRDPHVHEAHISLGLLRQFVDWDWSGAESAFRQAIRLAPGSGDAFQEYGALLARTGHPDQALATMARASSLDPLSAHALTLAAEACYYAYRFDQAISNCLKALELDATYTWSRVLLGSSLLQAGRRAEALGALQSAVDASGRSAFALGALGHARAMNGEKRAATSLLDALAILHVHSKDVAVFVSLIHVGLSQNDEALEWLHRARKERSAWMIAARADPRFHPLQGLDGYDGLMRDIGLTT